MAVLGYALSSEEHPAPRLVELAQAAEEAGFAFALISDHYHPWVDRQGESPFVWGVLGAIAQATRSLEVGTGVTAPILRVHPAIIAQAAATAASLMEGRFFLGVGTGERLNEHVIGARWPTPTERIEMLDEAITLIRRLWSGEEVSHRGPYYTVEHARLYSRPSRPPPLLVASAGGRSARLAAERGDGLIGLSPDPAVVGTFLEHASQQLPRVGKLTACWAPSFEEAQLLARAQWPNTGLTGDLSTELSRPADFESATAHLTAETVGEKLALGPDPEVHVRMIEQMIDGGYDFVYVHQIGHDQEGFFRFYAEEILPRFAEQRSLVAAASESARAAVEAGGRDGSDGRG